jgi:[mycofactocin precursor peptide]-tyrosine decarboxylase / 3-amino-5-[(4-hydroxyphenyl)methyl]-4,4-dimethylpyrrolidin-2-one synthase
MFADLLQQGLRSPICLTWELTYACNLQCIHCLSASGRRDPNELDTAECLDLIDEIAAMGVFYVNIGGGEPLLRRDFFVLVDHAVANGVGVKFSTNGYLLEAEEAARIATTDYLDVQISVDGLTEEVNDATRGRGSFRRARTAMEHLVDAGVEGFKISVTATRHNIPQLPGFLSMASELGAQLRVTRLRPSGRGIESWHHLRPTQQQQRTLHRWLSDHPEVLTGDSFFHLSALGEPLPGLGMCGAGRTVCLVDPIGDVYACPFAIHENFRAGSTRDPGGFARIWSSSRLFADIRGSEPVGTCASCWAVDNCKGGCMAAKFFTGNRIDGPDPECTLGYGSAGPLLQIPIVSSDHSWAT